MFPFHTWLPDAHVEAPTAGSVILAGVLLKLGGYGFIRFAVPLFPDAAHTYAPAIIVLSVIAIIYGAIVALVQPDLKKLVAYSSVSHMGFVTLGIFVFQEQGLQGAILQMVQPRPDHGRAVPPGGRDLRADARPNDRQDGRPFVADPGLCRCLRILHARVGRLPGLSGFIGEFLVFVGSFAYAPVVAAASTFVMILAAAYLLWMFQRIFFGELSEFFRGHLAHLTDLRPVEALTLVPLAVLVVVFGLFPGLVLVLVQGTVTEVLQGAATAHAIKPRVLAVGTAS